MDYEGAIASIAPLWDLDGDGEVYRAAGLKNWDDESLVAAIGKGSHLNGYVIRADWSTGDWSKLSDAKINIHDVQRSYGAAASYSYSYDAFWTPQAGETYQETDVATGAALVEHAVPSDAKDVNHVQPIEDDARAVFSSRMTNAIIKGEARSGEALWVLGGDDGEFSIEAPSGEVHSAGYSYWRGQHNAQYIGDGEYAMFDNNYDHEDEGSRMLIVSVDEDAYEAKIEWEYDVDTYSKVFGDNDRLPTGNLLGCWWQSSTYAHDDAYDAKVVELVRASSEVAFELEVSSDRGCSAAASPCSVDGTWLLYSVEKFYTAPLIANVTCDGDALAFLAWDTYKATSAYPGSYTVYDDDGALRASGSFDFAAYWRTTTVSVADAALSSGSVLVENRWGSSASVEFTC